MILNQVVIAHNRVQQADFFHSQLRQSLNQFYKARSFSRVENTISQGCSFTSYTDFNTIAGSDEHDYYLLKNPSGSGKRLMITHFSFGVDSSSARSTIRIYADPTITVDGTALTSINTYIQDTPKAGVATSFRDPTITDRGTKLNTQISPTNTPSRGLNRFYLVDPGHSILVTLENSIGNASSFAEAYWLEVN